MRILVANVITLLTELLGNFLRASPDLIKTPQRFRTSWDLMTNKKHKLKMKSKY